MKIEAAVIRVPGEDFGIERIDIGQPKAGEVLVRIAGVGLCHTDLVFSGGARPYPAPAVLGHEGAGTVVEVGPGVEGFAPGDEVIIGFASCGACPNCAAHLPSYCSQFLPLNFRGSRADGSTALSAGDQRIASHFFGQSSFASHAVAGATNLVKVPETTVPLALLGPLACSFQTGAGAVMRSMACKPGSSLVVAGGGPVGLAAIMAGAIQGCGAVILVEPIAARRELALELGATAVIDPVAGDLARQIRNILAAGVDNALDTTGRHEVIEGLNAVLAMHGMLGLLGATQDAAAALSVNISRAMLQGHRIIGILEGDSDQQAFIPELLAHHRAGRFPFDRLARTFPLSRINEAIAAQARGACVKAVLIPDHDAAGQ